MRKTIHALLVGGCCAAAVAVGLARPQASDEAVARRQYDSGRSFMRSGNYAEALKDFQAVAETHGASSVADDALLEIGRYYLDVVGDTKQAFTAVDAILKKYATSNSAPDAYVMSGRLALARSHQPADLASALADFERVARLFPTSEAVPRSLQLAGETLWLSGRLDEALASVGRAEVEYPTHRDTAAAYLTASRILVAQGDPIAAMEDLQQIRYRWPNTPEAATALGRLTLLHRLYVRGPAGTAFAATSETAGPAKLDNLVGLVSTGRGIYYATDAGVSVLTPADAPKPPAASRPRGLAVDAAGNPVVVELAALKTAAGDVAPLAVTKGNGMLDALVKLVAAVQISTGDWFVVDEDQKLIARFTRTGTYAGSPVAQASRLTVNAVDEVAAIDRDQRAVVLFDAVGTVVGRIPFKTTSYELPNPEDIAYDSYGHLYVLDRNGIAVFSPYPATPKTGAAAAPAATAAPAASGRPARAPVADRGTAYRLLTFYAPGDKAPGAIRKATAFAIDLSGGVYLYDESAKRIVVYR